MKYLNVLQSKKSLELMERTTRRLEKYFKRGLKDRDLYLRVISVIPLVLSLIYINLFYSYMTPEIPLWQTKVWGSGILASRITIYLIPAICVLFTALAMMFSYLSKKFYFTFLSQILLTTAIIFNTVGFINVMRISYIASGSYPTIINLPEQTRTLLLLMVSGFLISFLILPRFIVWAFRKGLVTDPVRHKHPGMILRKPSARGGGFVFSVLFTFLFFMLIEKNALTVGIALATLISGLIGLLDDYQNTAFRSRFKFLENPVVRLFVLLPIPVIVMMIAGVVSGYVNNPFDGNLVLTDIKIGIGQVNFTPLPYVFTLVWTLAIMNMISWSNGVDGQFGGIAGISLIIIGLLALRLVATEPSQISTAKIAFLAAGISFGFIPHTWHPSKVMWGFGAVSLGILLSSLSIVSRAKVATTIMVIMIPFFDGFVTVMRRIIQKKNPLKGDRGHLHHILLERGWSPQRVSLFYWTATAFFGVIGLAAADQSSALVSLIFGGIVASIIIFLNITSRNGKTAAKELPKGIETLQ